MDYLKRRRQIGQNIVRERKLQGITQQQLSDMSDVNVGYLCEAESGQANISMNKLFRIADTLGVSASYLLEDPLEGFAG